MFGCGGVCACVRACVSACVRACMRARARARVCVCVCVCSGRRVNFVYVCARGVGGKYYANVYVYSVTVCIL